MQVSRVEVTRFQINAVSGTLAYQVGTRNAMTALRLKNGETQVLAGLINDEDRTNASKVPGLGDIPIIGRLFSTNRTDRIKTEIVLLITPRIVRNVVRPEFYAAEFSGGTDLAAGHRETIDPAALLEVAGEDTAADLGDVISGTLIDGAVDGAEQSAPLRTDRRQALEQQSGVRVMLAAEQAVGPR